MKKSSNTVVTTELTLSIAESLEMKTLYMTRCHDFYVIRADNLNDLVSSQTRLYMQQIGLPTWELVYEELHGEITFKQHCRRS